MPASSDSIFTLITGGTIKFFVKLLNVELQKTEKPKICTDVQTKLMEDVMDGLECIVGRQKAKGILSECFRGTLLDISFL